MVLPDLHNQLDDVEGDEGEVAEVGVEGKDGLGHHSKVGLESTAVLK